MKKLKHTIRDFIVFLISISGTAFAYRWSLRKKGPLVRVVCFHDVPDRVWFASILDLFRDRYKVITPSEFHSNHFDEHKINILITFDDGYQSWITNCLPELQKRDIKALFFINSGLLDVSGNKEATDHYFYKQLLISQKEPLTWDGAGQIKNAGHTLGGHTVNHVSLSNVSLDQVKEEVQIDKIKIESHMDVTLRDFAYPFGTQNDYSKMTQQEVLKIGYTYQYSAVSSFYNFGDSIIPRTLIESNQSFQKVHRWILGGYDIFRASIS